MSELKNSITQIVTNLKKSNCDKTQNLKLSQNFKTKIGTKIKYSNINKQQNSKTQNVTKLNKLYWDKTKKKTQVVPKL